MAGWPCCHLLAQGPQKGKEAPAAKKKPGGVVEVGPSLIVLPDKKGELVLAPKDLTYEEFIELYKLKRQLTSTSAPPTYVLKNSTLTATVTKDIAAVECHFVFRVLRKDWVKIPLGLKKLKLTESPKLANDNNQLFVFDKSDGHQVWMRGADPKKDYQIKLKMMQRVQRSGYEQRLSLDTPQGSFTSVQIKLSSGVPMEGRIWQSGAQETPWLPASPPKRKSVSFKFDGVSGDLAVAWRKKAQATVRQPPLVVTGKVFVRVEGMKHDLRTEVSLSVRSRGVPIQSVLVSLPANMQLLKFAQPGYSVSPKSSSNKSESLVEVRFDQRTESPPPVRIFGTIAQQTGSTSEKLSWKVDGFSVRKALYQIWQVDFAVDNDMKVRWQHGNRVRRVAAPAAKNPSDRVDARFEYYGPASRLGVSVQPKPTRVTIAPLYVIRASATQLEMEIRLSCRPDGTNYWGLAVDLNGWEIDQVGPEPFVQTQEMDMSVLSPLVIPLKSAALSSPQMEVRIKARRAIERGAEEFHVKLPQARLSKGSQGASSRLFPGTVIVIPANNIELTPAVSRIKGLTSESTVDPKLLQGIGETAGARLLAYRQGDVTQDPSEFVTKRQIRKQSIAIDVGNNIRIERREAGVRQELKYTIDFEPTDTIRFQVPPHLIQDGLAKFKVDSKEFGELMAMPAGSESQESTQFAIKLPRKVSGELRLVVQYLVAMPELRETEAVKLKVPLIQPVESAISSVNRNQLTLNVDQALKAEVTDDAWETNDQASGTAIWSRGDSTAEVQLAVARNRRTSGLAQVRQLWVQTWLVGTERFDRAVFRVESSSSQLRISLPPASEIKEVAVNAIRQANRADGDELTIDLPSEPQAANAEHVVEVWYRCDPPSGDNWAASLSMPQIKQAREGTRFFWQLILPKHQLVVFGPNALTAQNSWGWQGWYWGARPELDQRQLEDLMRTSRQVAVPMATNQYLFTAFEFVPEIEFTYVSRRTAFLFSSLLVLGLGLLLLRFSLFREPGFLLALACLIGYGVFVYPEVTVTFAQTAVAGFVLILVVAFARSALGRRPRTSRGAGRASERASTTRAAQPLSSLSIGSSEVEAGA